MIQEWGGFPRNVIRINEEALNLFNGAAEGKKELRNFQMKKSSGCDADCAVREWCGRAGGSIPRNAQSVHLNLLRYICFRCVSLLFAFHKRKRI